MKDRILFVAIAVLLAFVLFRFYHYTGDRRSGHDRYPVGTDKAGKCPDLDMWGLKWSTLLALTIFNTFVLIWHSTKTT